MTIFYVTADIYLKMVIFGMMIMIMSYGSSLPFQLLIQSSLASTVHAERAQVIPPDCLEVAYDIFHTKLFDIEWPSASFYNRMCNKVYEGTVLMLRTVLTDTSLLKSVHNPPMKQLMSYVFCKINKLNYGREQNRGFTFGSYAYFI